MRFLIITKSKYMVPPDVMLGLVESMEPWQKKYAGKLEQIWGFAGTQGGGGICNVESLDELDAIMTDFPFGSISDIEVLPLVDLPGSLERIKRALRAMGAGS
jgi:muconolactone delta-isomerase